MKNTNEFINEVAEMREAQKRYFATRRTSFLIRSKALEKEVDEKLEAHYAERRKEQLPDPGETLMGHFKPH